MSTYFQKKKLIKDFNESLFDIIMMFVFYKPTLINITLTEIIFLNLLINVYLRFIILGAEYNCV